MIKEFDVVLLTQKEYINPKELNDYVQNVLLEDGLLKKALKKKGLRVAKKSWDDAQFDWSLARYVIFRTTWDYFHRLGEFKTWLKKVETQTKSINPFSLIHWSLHKFYLRELSQKGVPVSPALYLNRGNNITLDEVIQSSSWDTFVLKPAVSGGGRHTYKFDRENYVDFNDIFQNLVGQEDMLLQQYQNSITERGEVALMVFGGRYSHAVLKKAKEGEFKVQDDYGGTVHDYIPNSEEIKLAEKIVSKCPQKPIYARVDLFWSDKGEILLAELELIEPELWFRFCPSAADDLAQVISTQF